jgi:Family of unknown function (DUF5985)
MNPGDPKLILNGALAMSSWVAGLFFLRFWKSSGDRLFVYFCIAFWLLALNWLGLAVIHSVPETRHQVFFLRILAFVLIIIGIVDKNHRARSNSGVTKTKTRSNTEM